MIYFGQNKTSFLVRLGMLEPNKFHTDSAGEERSHLDNLFYIGDMILSPPPSLPFPLSLPNPNIPQEEARTKISKTVFE